jgi:hypothetical protein
VAPAVVAPGSPRAKREGWLESLSLRQLSMSAPTLEKHRGRLQDEEDYAEELQEAA